MPFRNARRRLPMRRRPARRGLSRPWARFNPNRALFTASNPYSDSFIHKFVRLGSYARLGSSNDGTIAYLQEDVNTVNGQWSISSPGPQNDNIGPYVGLGQFGLTFTAKLNSIINNNNFSNLFAQFRIDKVELTVTLLNGPSFGQGSAGSPVVGIIPEMFVKFDPDNNLMPTNFEEVAQSANCLRWSFTDKTSHTFSFIPQAGAVTQAFSGNGTMYVNNRCAWYDTQSSPSSSNFYGLKFWVRNFQCSLGNTALFAFEPKYFLSFRRPN